MSLICDDTRQTRRKSFFLKHTHAHNPRTLSNLYTLTIKIRFHSNISVKITCIPLPPTSLSEDISSSLKSSEAWKCPLQAALLITVAVNDSWLNRIRSSGLDKVRDTLRRFDMCRAGTEDTPDTGWWRWSCQQIQAQISIVPVQILVSDQYQHKKFLSSQFSMEPADLCSTFFLFNDTKTSNMHCGKHLTLFVSTVTSVLFKAYVTFRLQQLIQSALQTHLHFPKTQPQYQKLQTGHDSAATSWHAAPPHTPPS